MSARGHLLEAVRFATADQLAAIVDTLSSQCRDNELIRSCFAGPLVRRSARVAEPMPSLDELLGGAHGSLLCAMRACLCCLVTLELTTYADALPSATAVELHLPTAANDDQLLISMLTPGPVRLAKPTTIALRSGDDLLRRQIVDRGGSVPLLCRWLSRRDSHAQ